MDEKLIRTISFLKEVEAFKHVERQNYVLPGRPENDAEHSWHLSMLLIAFHQEIPSLDLGKMLVMASIHDLPEIYAGDSSAFDTEARDGKKQRESAAAEKLFSFLPSGPKEYLTSIYEEYEARKSKEALLVSGMDKLQPILQNLCAEGEGWKQLGVTYEEVDAYKRDHMEGDGLLMKVYEALMAEARERRLL